MESKAKEFLNQKIQQFKADADAGLSSIMVEAIQEFSDQQNATLIEQNRKLRDELQFALIVIKVLNSMGDTKPIINSIEQTLKDTADGK